MNNIYILVGLPGTGKSTWAQSQCKDNDNVMYFSSDKFRQMYYNNECEQKNPAFIFGKMQEAAIYYLKNGFDVIYDSCAITRKDRASIIHATKKIANVYCILVWSSIDECIARDAARSRSVGKKVIDKMVKKFEAPYYDEGFDEIIKINNSDLSSEIYEKSIIEAMRIPHNNVHHTLDVYEHCQAASNYVMENYNNPLLAYAASIHDIGKPYTKAFKNGKNEDTTDAHYYSHHNVGAWLAYGISSISFEVPWLISTHMEPFFNSRYYKNLEISLKDDIDKLHKADLEAH